ncbi:MAG: ABC transporter substrate-binding protein [Candidatus Latescibacterota bacterium]|nr:MAG: ABC transporter substrate-binding protein [Candidatus Latescibacterota bacterium]
MVFPGGVTFIKDDLGNGLVLLKRPERIISLVPSITETLVELGAGELLVGVTDYCIHPKQVVAGIPKVGGTKGFSPEKIDALGPDLVIANKEENRKDQIDALRERYNVYVTYPRTVTQAMKTVQALGSLTRADAKACEIAQTCDRIIASTNRVTLGTQIETACMVWRDPWMAVGTDTYVSGLLEVFGFRNVFVHSRERYPKTTLDEIVARRPEVVILPSEPYEFGESDVSEVKSFFG